ncbi:MAG: O-antigen ligase family protein [Verrucomicrobiales bacterium]
MKFLDILSKGLFLFGFLMVCLIGTAPDIPFHMLGLPLCGAGLILAVIGAAKAGTMPRAGFLPWTVFAAIAYLAGRAFFSPTPHLADMDLFLIAGFGAGFGMTWFSGRVRWLEPWLWVLAVAGTVIGLLHVTGYPRFTILSSFGLYRPLEEARASGFFFHPNPFGTWSVMLLLLAAGSFFFRGGSFVGRSWAGIGMLAAGLGVLLSFCRASLVGAGLGVATLFVATLVVVARWRAPGWKKGAAAIGIFVLMGGLGWGISEWLPRLAAMRTESGEVRTLFSETGNRQLYWKTGLSQFLESPLTGTGSRTFSYRSFEFWESGFQDMDKDPEYAHSEYVQVLADYGFLGLLVVLALVGAALVHAFSRAAVLARRDQSRDGRAKLAWCLGCLGAGVAFLGDVAFSFSGHFAPMVVLLGLMLGGLSSIRNQSADEKPGPAGFARWLGSLPVIACSVYLIFPGFNYGLATARSYLAFSAYSKDQIQPDKYLEIAEEQARLVPRYPFFYHAGGFALAVADVSEAEKALALREKALDWFNKALEAFPESLDARLERASLFQKMGRYAKADEDFAIAAERGKHREFYYRAWMKWGEARRDRAIEAWQMGDTEAATRWLKLSLEAYEHSKRLGWVAPDDLRYFKGRENVEELIAFFRRTGEWPSADTPTTKH